MKYLGQTSSGSVQDLTYSHNRYGQYTRRRATPTNPSTVLQSQMRGYFANASAAWRTLNDGQRSAWEAWAAGHPVIDRLGQSQTLTGAAFFVGVQTLQLKTGQAIIPSAPLQEPSWSTVSTGISASYGGGTMTLSHSGLVVNEGLVLEMAAPIPYAGKYVTGWRYITAVFASTPSPVDIYAAWTGKFGGFLAGSIIPYRVKKCWWGVAALDWIEATVTAGA